MWGPARMTGYARQITGDQKIKDREKGPDEARASTNSGRMKRLCRGRSACSTPLRSQMGLAKTPEGRVQKFSMQTSRFIRGGVSARLPLGKPSRDINGKGEPLLSSMGVLWRPLRTWRSVAPYGAYINYELLIRVAETWKSGHSAKGIFYKSGIYFQSSILFIFYEPHRHNYRGFDVSY